MLVSRPAACTRSRKDAGTLLPVIVLVAAVAAALSGVVLVSLMLVTRSTVATLVAPGQEAQAGGLSLRVDSADWLAHDMMPGMPPSAMPGMPAQGEQRFQVAFILQNPGDGPRDFTPDDFRLRSAGGESWSPVGSNFVAGTLGPGQALEGAFFFHVPETESGLLLAWTRGGDEVQIPVGQAPAHDHSPDGKTQAEVLGDA